MNLYDSLTQTVKPLRDDATMYACGVTVYDYCHVGHARSYVVWDVLRRWQKATNKRLKYVQNFTDIDDKIILRARKEGVSEREIADRFIAAYFEDMDWLGVTRADAYPRATEYFDEMLASARQLVEKSHAYTTEGDILFMSGSFKEYGKLSHRKPEGDFVLWKGPKRSEPAFPSGRPGWHLECSVMIEKTLGKTIDIHAGGNDLVFPHHENEIAQSECLHGVPLADIWLHNGMVEMGGNKMGKSLNNATTIRSYREAGMDPNILRHWILQSHYRKPLAKESLDDDRVRSQWASLREKLRYAPAAGVTPTFVEAMNNDLNTSVALAELFAHPTLEMASILGLTNAVEIAPPEILQWASERDRLRDEKRWQEADQVRDRIRQRGWEIRDGKEQRLVKVQ